MPQEMKREQQQKCGKKKEKQVTGFTERKIKYPLNFV